MQNYDNRKFVVLMIFIGMGLIFIFRLFYIQILDEKWEIEAAHISESRQTLYPVRGLIQDRHGKILVENRPVYNVLIKPAELEAFDTTMLCELLNIDSTTFYSNFNKALAKGKKYKRRLYTVLKDIPAEDFAAFNDQMHNFPGFYEESRSLRYYPAETAAHVLGYLREINEKGLAQNPSYTSGDYWGINGLEKAYEDELKGEKGVRYFLRDALNKKQAAFKGGKYDTLPVPGKDLVCTLDAELQAYGELLMQNKIGSIVAIEPASGEILSMISAPTYNPNSLVGRRFNASWKAYAGNDSLKPLINKAIFNDSYRPGSIFKLIQALVAMDEKLIHEHSAFMCNKSLIGCHFHEHPYNVQKAIQHSCNPYFYQVYKRMIQRGKAPSIFEDSRIGLTHWRSKIQSFGFGKRLETDLPGIKSGQIPDTSFYDKWYGKKRWAFSTIYSNSIGEGEIQVAPVQMANLAAIIANKGFFITPHFIKRIGSEPKPAQFERKNFVDVDSAHFQPVIEGMRLVVTQGTAKSAQVAGIDVCGKTGTVENKSFNDHSVFIAFAPQDNPQIAIAVYVEYGTWGGTWAAPIASLMIEKYLTGEIGPGNKRKEERVLKTVILDKHAKF